MVSILAGNIFFPFFISKELYWTFFFFFPRPYLTLTKLWWRCLWWSMTWERCQLIIKHSYGKELSLFLWDEKSSGLSIKKIVNRLKKGYFATSYIWGKLLGVKNKKCKNKSKYLPKFIPLDSFASLPFFLHVYVKRKKKKLLIWYLR